jgi:L-cysteine desulfidase
MRFEELLGLTEQLPDSVVELLRETVKKNVDACKAGLAHPMGIGTGYFGAGTWSGNFSDHLASITAAGSDARMSGHPVAIMTSAGSGNQGITATIPIVVYSKSRLIEEESMLRAVALSNLVTMYISCSVGYLSALCGVAIKAGIGAACGLTYLMGGRAGEIERAVKIMAATITGMICDGAKVGCALKVSNAADTALRAATLAMRSAEVPDDNGIVAATAHETIQNLAKLSRSMGSLDQKIIDIMLSKVQSASTA